MNKKLELIIALSDEVLIVVLVLFGIFYVLTYFGVVGFFEALTVGMIVVSIFLFIAYKIYSAHYKRPRVGPEAIVGRVGEVLEVKGATGVLVLDGELWKFECEDSSVRKGDKVVVVEVSGLVVKVKPLNKRV